MPKDFTFAEYIIARREQTSQIATDIRKSRGWTQDQLAKALNRSRGHINRVESGKASYTLEELEFLTVLFGLPAEHFTKMIPPAEDLLNLAVTSYQTHEALLEHFPLDLKSATAQSPKMHFHPNQPLLAVAYATENEHGILLVVQFDGRILARYEHPTTIDVFAYSPDGKFIAFGTTNDTAIVLDTDTYAVAAILDPVEQQLVDAAWWDFINDGEPEFGIISQVVFSPNGQIFGYLNEDTGTLRLWNTADWSHRKTIPVYQLLNNAYGHEFYDDNDPTNADHLYGEVAVSALQFASDNQTIHLFSAFGDYIDYLNINGKSIRHEKHDFYPATRAQFIVEGQYETTTYAMFAGSEQHFEIRSSSGSGYSTYRIQHAKRGHISNLLVLDHHTVLAFTTSDSSSDYLTVKNLVNNRPVTLYAPHAMSSLAIAPGGAYFAYFERAGWTIGPLIVHIYRLDLAKLRNERTIADLIAPHDHDGRYHHEFQRALPLAGEPVSAEPKGEDTPRFSLNLGQITPWFSVSHTEPDAPRPPSLAAIQADHADLAERLNELETTGLESNANRVGVYVIRDAAAPLDTILDHFPKAGVNTALGSLVVENATSRHIVAAIVNRTLLKGETTKAVMAEIARKHHDDIILLDYAEHITSDALVWLVSNAQSLARMMFLVVRNAELFNQHIREYDPPAWLLARMEMVDLEWLLEDYV